MKEKAKRNEHTPTPWYVSQLAKATIYAVVDGKRAELAVTAFHREGQGEVDAAFIVRAVNSHEELVKALKASLWIADCAIDADINGRKAAGCYRDGIKFRLEQIRAALAKAESQEGN